MGVIASELLVGSVADAQILFIEFVALVYGTSGIKRPVFVKKENISPADNGIEHRLVVDLHIDQLLNGVVIHCQRQAFKGNRLIQLKGKAGGIHTDLFQQRANAVGHVACQPKAAFFHIVPHGCHNSMVIEQHHRYGQDQ